MFSVIIPLHNKSNYIKKCVQSVFNQTYRDYEVIIVDDGSTDDSLQIIQRIYRSYEKNLSIIVQNNLGVSSARNNGVKISKNDYLAFLDADDWWDEHFLERMKILIEKCPEASLFGCNYYYVKNGKNRLDNKGLSKNFTMNYIDYISLYSSRFIVPFNCSFVIIRKDIFNSAGGFNPNLHFGEDFDLWLKIALKYKVAYCNEPLAFSNQDADISNKAVGSKKIYSPSENVMFNLGYLEKFESELPKLKTLLDGLRVRALMNYFLRNLYPDIVNQELNKVDFTKQPFYFRFIYLWPIQIVKLYLQSIKVGFKIKNALLRRLA